MGKKQSKPKRSSSKSPVSPQRREQLTRNHRKTILFNDKELSVIDAYCAKYKIRSKSAFIRNAVLSHIMKEMDENYPKLF